jgi:murein DD-endopeptidase MepM/ murein hydrolase activator NlpD
MKADACQFSLVVVACGALAVAGSSRPASPEETVVPAAAIEQAADLPQVTAGDGMRWLRETRVALDEATPIRMPFAEIREVASVDSAASAFAFDALRGQVLEVTLARDAATEGAIYVEVFRVVEILGQPLHERLTALRPSASNLRTKLPSDGTYHVLVQADGTSAGQYRLTLELGAALPFPVVGAKPDTIRSLFGASRDSGRRHHQGVDIYVKRLTPVLAVAAGRAMPRQDALGGNTVWLNTPGTSYYYAHLERVTVTDQQRVKVGDVLGYVGTSGNAFGMPAHLHFGVYRWGKDPVDPLPLLLGQRFEEGSAAAAAALGDAGG